jgi:putative membrane protein
MRPSDLRQVHVLTLVFELLMTFVRQWKLVAFAIFLRFSGGGSGDLMDNLLSIGIGCLAVISAAFAYFTVRFGFEGNSLLYKIQTPFKKEEKLIPLDRIQEVEFKRNLLHKALGLVEIEINTGSAKAESEVSLNALRMEDAVALRKEIFERRGKEAPKSIAEASPDQIIFQASWKHLILAGLGSNAALLIVASAFGLMQELDRGNRSGTMQKVFEALRFLDPTKNVYGFIAALIGLFLVGWIFGIGKSVVSLYGFTLVRDGDRLVRRSGLFNETQKSSPINRIQGIEIEEKLIHRMLNLAQIKVGFTMGTKRGEEAAEHLCPIIERDLAPTITDLVYPDLKLPTEFGLTRPAKTLFWRFAYSGIIFYGIVLIGLRFTPQFQQIGTIIVGLLFLRMVIDDILRARQFGWLIDDDFLILQQGGFRLTMTVIPLKGAQKVQVNQSFFQRRMGLCDVSVGTAAVGVGSNGTLMNVPVQDANQIMQHLMDRSLEIVEEISDPEPILPDLIPPIVTPPPMATNS